MTSGRIPRLRAPALTISILFAALALSFVLLGSFALADDTTTVPPEVPTEDVETTQPAPVTATASTSLRAHQPGDAVDGSKNTYWAAISRNYPQWLMVDLGAPQRVVKSSISWLRLEKSRKYFYRLEGSLDGQEWQLLADRTKKSAYNFTNDTLDVEVQYLRVTMLGANRGRAGIKEMRVKKDTTDGDEWVVVTPTPEPSPEPTEPGDEWAVVTPTPTPTPTVAPTGLSIRSLSTSHASIGAPLTITGTGFGSSRGTSKVYFGELPQYTFGDGHVSRPCTEEAANYVSWSDTEIVVTVPSMSPGLAGAPGTYHPVYVEVNGEHTNRGDFYIDPVTTLDASSSPQAWAAVFPNSVVTVETKVYPNSAGSKHSSYTTQVTLDATNGPRPWGGNYIASNTHDVLIKDATFICDNALSPSDAGIITFGATAAPTPGWWGASTQYNITFHNCVVKNNLLNDTGWNGTNAIKCYHGSESAGRYGDMTWSDCSVGTPGSRKAFSRFGVELVENNRGFSSYTDNYLHNIRFTGCDFERPSLIPLSFACGGRGPDRGYLVDNCVLKGGSSGIEFHMYGLVVRDVDIWPTSSAVFSMEGNSSEFGGVTYIGPESYTYFLRVDLHPEIDNGVALPHDSFVFNSDHFGGVVLDDCDLAFGDSSNHYGMASYISLFDTNDGWDMSTSYIHGTSTWGPVPKTSAVQYWTDWTGAAPAAVYADNNMKWPKLGVRP